MRTTIIRDEWITALSLDLTETKRFAFVRGALGDAEGVDLASKAAEVVRELQVASKRRESEYEAAHARLADLISQRSEARAALGRSEDLEWARQVVSAYLGDGKTEVSLGLSAGREALVEGRVGLERKGEGLNLARELAEVKERYYAPDAVKYRETVVQEVEHARERKSQVDAALAQGGVGYSGGSGQDRVVARATVGTRGAAGASQRPLPPLCCGRSTSSVPVSRQRASRGTVVGGAKRPGEVYDDARGGQQEGKGVRGR